MSTISTNQPTEVTEPDNRGDNIVDNSATTEKLWKPRKLTGKQRAFIKHLLDNPKATASQAYMAAYDTHGKPETIHVEASRTLSKPQVQAALDNNVELFESVITGTAKDWGDSDNTRQRELALQASYYGHDKVKGKAKQVTESVSTSVNLNLDLTDVIRD